MARVMLWSSVMCLVANNIILTLFCWVVCLHVHPQVVHAKSGALVVPGYAGAARVFGLRHDGTGGDQKSNKQSTDIHYRENSNNSNCSLTVPPDNVSSNDSYAFAQHRQSGKHSDSNSSSSSSSSRDCSSRDCSSRDCSS
eukprot:Lankesteria_metandrocarpae@DN3628_c0_g1_i1.p1